MSGISLAQYTQNVRGKVVDVDSKQPLAGVNITIPVEGGKTIGTSTDDQGYFEMTNVPIGRQAISFYYVGYEELALDNIIVTSGKEVELKVEMSESADMLKAATVTGRKREASNNDMVTVSSRSFDAEEAERYPGSRQDPARMAQNFAGVAGTDDQRNDIVIRGNSPLGLLWRFEGIDIFNPSHFAVAGSSGGPISMLNNKVIGNSDFMTGAFPAEYSNAISGVFDVKMRNGNYNKSEYSGQFGLFGTEILAEGPISKEKKSSYLFSYRYATFSIFNSLNIDLGTEAVPEYQDMSFRLNFPTKKGGFSVFGLGGLSSIDIVFSDDPVPSEELYGLKDRDQYFRTNMGVVGVNWRRFINPKTYISAVVAHNIQQVLSDHDKIFRQDPTDYTDVRLFPVSHSEMQHSKTTAHVYLNKKYSARSNLRVGLIADAYNFDYFDSVRNERTFIWSEQLDYQGSEFMTRGYVSWKYRLNSRLTMNSGMNLMHTTMGNDVAAEPRLGFKYLVSSKSNIGLAYGLHSQLQPLYVYFTQFTDSVSHTFGTHNNGLKPTRSHHLVASYENMVSSVFRFRSEVYYQQLYNVPVEQISSSFSLLNQGSGFQRFFPDVLENTGTGTNYGIELTLERFFHKNYYAMATASLYNSRYKGSDGVDRSTDFNGNYIVNALAGYELPFGKAKKNAVILGTKFTIGGGKRFSPIDSVATKLDGAKVHIVDSERNTIQFEDYYRLDLKFGMRFNSSKATHEFSIDLMNVLDVQNVLTISYFDDPKNPGNKIYAKEYQLGFLPNFWYKFNF